jgi:hypothetical protein
MLLGRPAVESDAIVGDRDANRVIERGKVNANGPRMGMFPHVGQ